MGKIKIFKTQVLAKNLKENTLEREVCFSMCYNQSGRLTSSLPKCSNLQPGLSTSVLNAADIRPNDIHGLPFCGGDVRFALRWWVFSSEVLKLNWFCFWFCFEVSFIYLQKKQQTHLAKNELVVKSVWRSNCSSMSNVRSGALKKCD